MFFQCEWEKSEGFGDVMMRYLSPFLYKPWQKWWLIRHHFITKSTRPFLCALKNLERPGVQGCIRLANLAESTQDWVMWGYLFYLLQTIYCNIECHCVLATWWKYMCALLVDRLSWVYQLGTYSCLSCMSPLAWIFQAWEAFAAICLGHSWEALIIAKEFTMSNYMILVWCRTSKGWALILSHHICFSS